MGNYYSGMINNKFGYGELRHARTKGSRNGYSTTPGYVAIGKKAQGPKERESQGRSFSSVFGSKLEVAKILFEDERSIIVITKNKARVFLYNIVFPP